MALTTQPADLATRPAAPASTGSPTDDAAAAAAVVVAPASAAPRVWAGAAPSEVDALAAFKASVSSAAKAWGPPVVAASAINLSRDEFASAPVSTQKARLGELKVEKAALGTKIQDRAAALDSRWQRSSVSTKTEALRQYHQRSTLLDPAARRELSGMVKKSEEAQVKITTLREKSDLLLRPQSESCTPEENKAANELAGKLADAREAQSAAVERATTAIDKKGLKIDRLAVTEDVIDPNGEARGGVGETLLALVDKYSDVSSMIAWVIDVFADALEERREQQAEDRQVARKLAEQQKAYFKDDDKKRAAKSDELRRDTFKADQRRKAVIRELSAAFQAR